MAPLKSLLAVINLSLFISGSFGAITNATTTVCNALSAALPNNVVFQTGISAARYKTENANYWNVGLSELKPACIVMPSDVQMVSKAVAILSSNKDVKFSIKSGGHDPNPGQSSIDGGVLIALSQINGTTYDEEKKVAYVKPGGTWSNVIEPLEKYNVTVLGGRLGIVGVGGYLAMGGLSFLSAQHGMACDVRGACCTTESRIWLTGSRTLLAMRSLLPMDPSKTLITIRNLT
jgi:hypothetical protein